MAGDVGGLQVVLVGQQILGETTVNNPVIAIDNAGAGYATVCYINGSGGKIWLWDIDNENAVQSGVTIDHAYNDALLEYIKTKFDIESNLSTGDSFASSASSIVPNYEIEL